MPRHICLIFEAIGNMSGIAKVAYEDVVNALQAGYRVTVVAQQLDERLRPDVEWLPLYVPKRLFLLKWATARYFIRRALGGRKFDLVHAHQPQAASIADVFTCHFLTRVAYERYCLASRSGIRGRLVYLQQLAAMRLEDRCYRHWNPQTRMIFCSDLLRREFERLYGEVSSCDIIDNACSRHDASPIAAVPLFADHPNPVVGYLGGRDPRKGFQAIINAAKVEPHLSFRLGGVGTAGVSIPPFKGRLSAMGHVTDVDEFYRSCDVIVVPSLFDPNPLVVLEAVSRGVPVIATEGVGNLHHLLRTGAGLEWKRGESLGGLVEKIVRDKLSFVAGTQRMTEDLSSERRAAKMRDLYQSVLKGKSPT